MPGQGDDTIILPAGGGTTTLTATLNITSTITITGNGHIISGGGTVRVISIGTRFGRLTLNNVTIENGWATGSGSSYGGAIRITAGALTVNNSTFKNNSARDRGGAVYASAPITIRNSTFSGNSATSATSIGGAIALYHSSPTRSELIHLTVAGGNTAVSGAGVYTTYICAFQFAKQHNRQQQWHGGSKLSNRYERHYGPHSDRQFGRDANRQLPGSDNHQRSPTGRPHHQRAFLLPAGRQEPGDRRW